jgi:CubicO group peptidase (beta-lactamase class C family)
MMEPIDFNNWTLPPHNRWSFQRVQQFTRTARIPRGPDFVPLQQNSQELADIKFENTRGQTTTVAEILDQTWSDGFLVLHRGQVVAEQYFNGMGPDTLHLMMSCSKSMTSALVGGAIVEGSLDSSQLITHYIPELAASGFAGATVQQALDMRVGVQFDEDYENLEGEWRDLEIATGWREPAADYVGPRDMLSYMQILTGSVGPHGGVFNYQSILTDVVGVCLERATDKSFLDLFAEKIWHPMGAEQDLVTIVDACGTAIFEGGFNCCLRDFARFGQLICNGGVASGQQLVPENWIDECRFPASELIEAFARSSDGELMPGYTYHNKWWIGDPVNGVMMALGIHGQTLYIDPGRDFVVAKFSSQPAHDDLDMMLNQVSAFQAILAFLER